MQIKIGDIIEVRECNAKEDFIGCVANVSKDTIIVEIVVPASGISGWDRDNDKRLNTWRSVGINKYWYISPDWILGVIGGIPRNEYHKELLETIRDCREFILTADR